MTAAGDGESSGSHLSSPLDDTIELSGRSKDAWRDELVDLAPGTEVGRFVIVALIGEGGMGAVYSARDPELDRNVAIKVLRYAAEGPNSQGEGRILREARAIAALTHPNVITVYDVGVHRGRVFMAMELVEGDSLQQWLENKPRPWRVVLDVFRRAGAGLAAAHAAGMVHRDFKPHNVLLGNDGRVRVMDFGLAIPQGSSLTPGNGSSPSLSASLDDLTRTGTLVGTPAFMAPEQHYDRPTAASDQFSFCVTLYRALYGQNPFEGRTVDELLAAIRAGKVRAPTSRRHVPRWLHAAVLRGLEADPAARWPSMEALLQALRPRRRTPWVAGAAVAGAAGVAAVLWPTGQSPDCDPDRRWAQTWNEARADAIAAALIGTGSSQGPVTARLVQDRVDAYGEVWRSTFAQMCAGLQSGNEVRSDVQRMCLTERLDELEAVAIVLAEADADMVGQAVVAVSRLGPPSACMDAERDPETLVRPDDPTRAAAVASTAGMLHKVTALEDAGRLDEALDLAESAVEAAEQTGWEPLIVRSKLALAHTCVALKHDDRAAALLTETATKAVAIGDDHAAALAAADLGVIHAGSKASFEQAQRWIKHAEAAAGRIGPGGRTQTYVLRSKGLVEYRRGDHDAAAEALERTVEIEAQRVGRQGMSYADAVSKLALVRQAQGRYEEALELLGQVAEIYGEVLGDDHPRVANTIDNVGIALADLGRYEEAIERHEVSLKKRIAVFGEEHEMVALSHNNLGLAAHWAGRNEKAVEHTTRAFEIWKKTLGEDHDYVAAALTNLGLAEARLGRLEAALAHHEQALEIRERVFGPEHDGCATSLANIGVLLVELGRFDQARANVERAMAIWAKTLGPRHPEMGSAYNDLGRIEAARGDHARAEAEYQTSFEILDEAVGANHPRTLSTLRAWADVRLQRGNATGAIELLERALRGCLEGDEPVPYKMAVTRFALAKALTAAGQSPQRAKALATEALEDLRGDDEHTEQRREIERWLASHG